MQTQPLNPFPMSDDKEPQPAVTMPAPAANPAAMPQQPSTPTSPTSPSVFVQPAIEKKTAGYTKGFIGVAEKQLVKLFSAPAVQMPEFARDMVSRFLPWLTLMACFTLAPILFIGIAMGGFLGFITSFYELNTNVFYWATIILVTGQLVLMGFAIPKLLKERRFGWQLIFVATLLSVLTLLMNVFAQFVQPLFGTIVGLMAVAVVLYVLIQVRPYYTE